MSSASVRSAHVDDIPSLRIPGVAPSEWKPVRHHLGVRAFGVNAFHAAHAGEPLIGEHDELADPVSGGQEHEELYVVLRGRATFKVDGRLVDAPAGTLVFVPDPGCARAAVAAADGTTVLAFGAQPDVAFRGSGWERIHAPDAGAEPG